MYGRIFQSMYHGSMFGQDPLVFAVWGYVLANAFDSMVELHPHFLAPMFNTTKEEIEAVIKKLCGPDPESRCKEHKGARLVKQKQYWYYVPSWEYYRKLATEEARREYMRIYMQGYRSKSPDCQQMSTDVNSCKLQDFTKANGKQALTHTEAEAETDTIKKKYKKRKFIPPTLSECEQYNKENDLGVDVDTFFHGYDDSGWIDSHGNPVRNWKLKMRTWASRSPEKRSKSHVERMVEESRL